MFKRILNLPLTGKSSIFLFGPRGTGKTTWLKSNVPDALYFDLLDTETLDQFATQPQLLDNLIPTGYTDWVAIDEIQQVPELLNEVHRLIELKKYKFILTCSHFLPLRQKGINLLAGRALVYHMHPLTIQEMGEHFSLLHALEYGMLPEAAILTDPTEYLAHYAQTYVLEDDPLMGIHLQPFTRRAKRKMVIQEKFYLFDIGVEHAFASQEPFGSSAKTEGAGLETLFLQSLRAINDYYDLGYKIYFWRTSAGEEVDFVLYGPRGLHAFEIKRSSTITPKTLKGLKLFHEDYPEARLHLIYPGKLREYHGPINAIPLVEALKELPEMLK